jgi:4-hydroxy-4-methyl-2-oxoglutarate aldolase
MIQDPPLLTVLRDWQRPAEALLAPLAGAQTGHVVDAMDGGGAMIAAIKPVDPARARFVGVALPCQTGPGDNLAVMAALALSKPGDVIVASAEAFAGSAIMGDNVAWMARNAGVVALVTDGVVRDAEGIRGIGLPMFAAGITPNSCARSGPGRVGLPVVCGGVAVSAGDVLVGDADGVVVIPQSMLPAVVARLAEVRAAETALQARIGSGLTHLEPVAALLRSERVRYV